MILTLRSSGVNLTDENGNILDFYTDYLLTAFGQTTATGLAALLNDEISHDQIQRWLASDKQTSAQLWQIAKPHVRKIEGENSVMIVDDSIAEKPYTDENDIICWHYDPHLTQFWCKLNK